MNDNEPTVLLIYAEAVEAGPNTDSDLTRYDDCAPGSGGTPDQVQGDSRLGLS